jgi:N-acetylglucosamine kinase
MEARRLVAAVDAGGTKTVCLIADTEGRIVGHGTGGPANINFSSSDAVHASLRNAFDSACSAAGVGDPPAEIAYLAAACAGPKTLLVPTLAERLPVERIHVVHEAMMALLGSLGGPVGCVVLAGTGSFARARGPGGLEHHVGGWGALLGDEGSAYDIGHRALVAVARAADGRGPATLLTDAILAHWGLAESYALKPLVYGPEMTQARIAGLAPLVSRVARDGDAAATAILGGAGRVLATAAVAAIRGAGLLGEPAIRVSTAGGVWRAGDLIVNPFATELRRQVPEAEVVRPLFAPIVGGLLLALGECGVAWTDDVLQNLAATEV